MEYESYDLMFRLVIEETFENGKRVCNKKKVEIYVNNEYAGEVDNMEDLGYYLFNPKSVL